MAEKDWISKYFAPLSPDGLKDDVALLVTSPPAIVTQDAMVEGVHFLPDDPIDTVARKLVRANVSDVLAKGALPKQAFLTLGWPKTRDETDLAAFASALGSELAGHGATLGGGDTVQTADHIFLSLTLIGKCIGEGPVTRSGASVGDDVWMTGEIGAAKLGFDAIQAGQGASNLSEGYRLPKLPKPAIATIISNHATAAMDVSDGLLIDAKTLAAASGQQIHLDLDAVPFAGSASDTQTRLALATWGDDYQALFTAAPAVRANIRRYVSENGVKLARIGTVKAGEGLKVTENGQDVNLPETLGFEHG